MCRHYRYAACLRNRKKSAKVRWGFSSEVNLSKPMPDQPAAYVRLLFPVVNMAAAPTYPAGSGAAVWRTRPSSIPDMASTDQQPAAEPPLLPWVAMCWRAACLYPMVSLRSRAHDRAGRDCTSRLKSNGNRLNLNSLEDQIFCAACDPAKHTACACLVKSPSQALGACGPGVLLRAPGPRMRCVASSFFGVNAVPRPWRRTAWPLSSPSPHLCSSDLSQASR